MAIALLSFCFSDSDFLYNDVCSVFHSCFVALTKEKDKDKDKEKTLDRISAHGTQPRTTQHA